MLTKPRILLLWMDFASVFPYNSADDDDATSRHGAHGNATQQSITCRYRSVDRDEYVIIFVSNIKLKL